ncbi:MAG: hypothetical protein RL625_1786 [Gemmatimonadota bacterium]|jgi:hypothetical protein
MHRPRRGLAITLVALSTTLAACVPVPVEWAKTTRYADGALADTLRLGFGADGAPVFAAEWTPPSWPEEPGQCLASRRAGRTVTDTAYASWFTVRADSSVLLRAARSDDGGRSWQPAVTADSVDVGRAGCARPVPFLAVDSLNGYLHLTYHLVAREGAGLFFTHVMDTGMLFHEPVPIVYGDRPSVTAVASRGDTVVVVYEDPNSRVPRLGIAVSRLQGHIFEGRMPASDEVGESRRPLVALRGDRVVIAWDATERGGRVPRVMLREGRIRWGDL